MIDQGFLSAFKLSPRLLKDEILWDDLKEPEYDVVRNKLLSQYKYPTHSKTYVRIKKEYTSTGGSGGSDEEVSVPMC